MSTRNLTRTLLLAAALMVALAPTSNAATPLFSSFVGPYQPITVSGLGTCSTARDGEVFLVTNATSSSVCTGTGSAASLCICDASAWRAIGGALAPTATLASTVTVADAAADTTTFPALAGSATGSLPVLTDPGLSYNASTNALTATTFVGALTGNADTATTATTATGIRQQGAAPSVCDAGTSLGQLYIDTTGPDLCWCSGAGGWVPADGTGTCA